LSAVSPYTDYSQTILALPPLKWDAQTIPEMFSTRVWVYFAIATPLTLFTMAFMYFWLRRRDCRDREIAKKARMGGQFDGSETNAELKNLFVTDEKYGPSRLESCYQRL
jgi:hypothetical protein